MLWWQIVCGNDCCLVCEWVSARKCKIALPLRTIRTELELSNMCIKTCREWHWLCMCYNREVSWNGWLHKYVINSGNCGREISSLCNKYLYFLLQQQSAVAAAAAAAAGGREDSELQRRLLEMQKEFEANRTELEKTREDANRSQVEMERLLQLVQMSQEEQNAKEKTIRDLQEWVVEEKWHQSCFWFQKRHRNYRNLEIISDSSECPFLYFS